MNSLSWLIYFAGVTGGVKNLLTFFSFAGIAIGLAGLIFGLIVTAHDEKTIGALLTGFGRTALPLGILAGLLQVAVPPPNTIYMIAASEMGEKVVTAPETRDMLDDLRAIVSKQLKKMRDDK